MSDVHVSSIQQFWATLARHEAEDCLEPLARAGDTLHDYVVGTAALIAEGAGDWVDVLEAIHALTTAQRNIRAAHEHLIDAMADKRVRLTDPLLAAGLVERRADGALNRSDSC